jgi:hypothetical protein
MSDELNVKELQELIAVQAMKDDSFRSELVANPNGTFEKYSGQALPEGVKIQVHENSSNVTHFVLPPKLDQGELSDDDLEKVAGGEFVVGAAIIGGVAATVAAGASIANDQTRSRGGW